MAEWLRSGLQNRVHRFNSGRHLQKRGFASFFVGAGASQTAPPFFCAKRKNGDAVASQWAIGTSSPKVTLLSIAASLSSPAQLLSLLTL